MVENEAHFKNVGKNLSLSRRSGRPPIKLSSDDDGNKLLPNRGNSVGIVVGTGLKIRRIDGGEKYV